MPFDVLPAGPALSHAWAGAHIEASGTDGGTREEECATTACRATGDSGTSPSPVGGAARVLLMLCRDTQGLSSPALDIVYTTSERCAWTPYNERACIFDALWPGVIDSPAAGFHLARLELGIIKHASPPALAWFVTHPFPRQCRP